MLPSFPLSTNLATGACRGVPQPHAAAGSAARWAGAEGGWQRHGGAGREKWKGTVAAKCPAWVGSVAPPLPCSPGSRLELSAVWMAPAVAAAGKGEPVLPTAQPPPPGGHLHDPGGQESSPLPPATRCGCSMGTQVQPRSAKIIQCQ